MADITEVATHEFSEKGLAGARINVIAEAMRTSKRMIYHYFGSKEGLYVAVLEEAYRRIRAIETDLHLDDLAPEDALRKLVGFTVDYQWANSDVIRLVMTENIHRGEYLAQSKAIRQLNVPAIEGLRLLYERGADRAARHHHRDDRALRAQVGAARRVTAFPPSFRRLLMHIAIMGSGGVGAYVGARLQAAGEQVSFIARGAHLQALQADGLRIEGALAPIHLAPVRATDDPAQVGPVDLIVFAVKLGDTEAAARAMQPLIGPGTRILTLQNGIDSVALLTPHAGAAAVRGGAIYVSAVIDRPGVIRSPGGLHTIVADAAGGDPVMAAFFAACDRATALDAKPSNAVDTVLWEKFIALSSLSATTSLLRAPMGLIMGHPETRALQRQLIDEAVVVGRAAGQTVRDNLADEIMAKLAALPAGFRSSMSEDLERGKPLELPWLSGRVHALGLQHGVPTPAHSTAYRALVLYQHGQPAPIAR